MWSKIRGVSHTRTGRVVPEWSSYTIQRKIYSKFTLQNQVKIFHCRIRIKRENLITASVLTSHHVGDT